MSYYLSDSSYHHTANRYVRVTACKFDVKIIQRFLSNVPKSLVNYLSDTFEMTSSAGIDLKLHPLLKVLSTCFRNLFFRLRIKKINMQFREKLHRIRASRCITLSMMASFNSSVFHINFIILPYILILIEINISQTRTSFFVFIVCRLKYKIFHEFVIPVNLLTLSVSCCLHQCDIKCKFC